MTGARRFCTTWVRTRMPGAGAHRDRYLATRHCRWPWHACNGLPHTGTDIVYTGTGSLVYWYFTLFNGSKTVPGRLLFLLRCHTEQCNEALNPSLTSGFVCCIKPRRIKPQHAALYWQPPVAAPLYSRSPCTGSPQVRSAPAATSTKCGVPSECGTAAAAAAAVMDRHWVGRGGGPRP